MSTVHFAPGSTVRINNIPVSGKLALLDQYRPIIKVLSIIEFFGSLLLMGLEISLMILATRHGMRTMGTGLWLGIMILAVSILNFYCSHKSAVTISLPILAMVFTVISGAFCMAFGVAFSFMLLQVMGFQDVALLRVLVWVEFGVFLSTGGVLLVNSVLLCRNTCCHPAITELQRRYHECMMNQMAATYPRPAPDAPPSYQEATGKGQVYANVSFNP